MNGDYVDRIIFQDTELHYFDANIYDEYYDFTIEFFSTSLLFSIMITVWSHQESFKYQNVTLNQSNVNTIHFISYLVGYLMTPSNKIFWPQPSMLVYALVTLSKIVVSQLFLKWTCISATNMLVLILSMITHHTLMIVTYDTSYLSVKIH